jgi:hypothetical protein
LNDSSSQCTFHTASRIVLYQWGLILTIVVEAGIYTYMFGD